MHNNKKILSFSLLITVILVTITQCCEKKGQTLKRKHSQELTFLNPSETPQKTSSETKYNVLSFFNVNSYKKYKTECTKLGGGHALVTIECHICYAKRNGMLRKAYSNMITHVEMKHKICGGKHLTPDQVSQCENCSVKKLNFAQIATPTRYKNEHNKLVNGTKVTIECNFCNEVVTFSTLIASYVAIRRHRNKEHNVCGCNSEHLTPEEASECKDCTPILTYNDQELSETSPEYRIKDNKTYLLFNFKSLNSPEKYKDIYRGLTKRTQTLVTLECNLCSMQYKGYLSQTYGRMVSHNLTRHNACKCGIEHPTLDDAQACACFQKKIKPAEKSFLFSNITPENYTRTYQNLPQRSMTKVEMVCPYCGQALTGSFSSVYIKMSDHTKMKHYACKCKQHETAADAFSCQKCTPNHRKRAL